MTFDIDSMSSQIMFKQSIDHFILNNQKKKKFKNTMKIYVS